jgi:hypothetical protein
MHTKSRFSPSSSDERVEDRDALSLFVDLGQGLACQSVSRTFRPSTVRGMIENHESFPFEITAFWELRGQISIYR